MIALLLLFACGGNDPDSDASAFDPAAWEGGDFDVDVVTVDDDCLGGAFEALFMPDGPAETETLDYTLRLPGYADLPDAYAMDLRAPFLSMPVTAETNDGVAFQLRGDTVTDLPMGFASYGDCTITAVVNADFKPSDQSTAFGSATIDVSNPRGDDDRCPLFDADPCTVALDLTALRN